MEWIIGIIVVVLVWLFLTANSRRESMMKTTIKNCYLFSPGQLTETAIYWEAAERFAHDRGTKTEHMGSGQSVGFEMKVNNEIVQVYISRNFDGTALISVENADIIKKRVMDKLNIDL